MLCILTYRCSVIHSDNFSSDEKYDTDRCVPDYHVNNHHDTPVDTGKPVNKTIPNPIVLNQVKNCY